MIFAITTFTLTHPPPGRDTCRCAEMMESLYGH
jgi:hypothetical protein